MSETVGRVRPMRAPSSAAAPVSAPQLGPMPTWKLDDLYPSPKSAAVEADLKQAAAAAHALKQRYQGKLAQLATDETAQRASNWTANRAAQSTAKCAANDATFRAAQRSPELAAFWSPVNNT